MMSRLLCQSAPVSPTPPLTPSFWLDFTDVGTLTLVSGKVSAATDKSGNAFNWAQSNAANRLVYDATLFGGSGGVICDYATGTGLLSNAAASTIHLNNFTYYLIGARTDGIIAGILQDFASGAVLGPTNYGNRYGFGQAASTMIGVPKNIISLIGVKNTGVSGTTKFFGANATKYPVHWGVGPASTNAMGNLSFGGKGFGANLGYSFKAAGILVFNTAHNDTQIDNMITWCKGYYGIPTRGLPRFNGIFSGDSITAGFFADGGTSYPELAMDALSFVPDQYQISAIGGQKIADMDGFDTTFVDPLYNSAWGIKNALSFFCGTNDLAVNGVSVPTVQADMTTYAGNRVSAGWPSLGVATILPSIGRPNASFNTDAATFNTWLRANYLAIGFTDLIDIAADPIMGPISAASDTSLYIDGVHPTALGHSYLAPYFQAFMGKYL